MKTKLHLINPTKDKSLLDTLKHLRCRISGSMKGGIEGTVNGVPIIIKHVGITHGELQATWNLSNCISSDDVDVTELLNNDLGINDKLELSLVKSHL